MFIIYILYYIYISIICTIYIYIYIYIHIYIHNIYIYNIMMMMVMMMMLMLMFDDCVTDMKPGWDRSKWRFIGGESIERNEGFSLARFDQRPDLLW